MGLGSEGLALVWVSEIRVGLEGREETGFQAWTPMPCGYLEGGSAEGQVGGRGTSGIEGREGVRDGGADRQNCWKVMWMTLKYKLRATVIEGREDKRLGDDSGEESDWRRPRERNARCRREATQYEYAITYARWHMAVAQNTNRPLTTTTETPSYHLLFF